MCVTGKSSRLTEMANTPNTANSSNTANIVPGHGLPRQGLVCKGSHPELKSPPPPNTHKEETFVCVGLKQYLLKSFGTMKTQV